MRSWATGPPDRDCDLRCLPAPNSRLWLCRHAAFPALISVLAPRPSPEILPVETIIKRGVQRQTDTMDTFVFSIESSAEAVY
ncbi:hypothetical protein SKAU_G00405620 [Synaphobranchus kaupii]|uniref:Uncharacterized protein n=1 Tax=Synaphobranchus kaupii TaxID=118154 RepID=A0A9Q1E9V5_SYNKA|nr:hypothetical protein SKAU_G00405620 [Synaphobranchus kaupii]